MIFPQDLQRKFVICMNCKSMALTEEDVRPLIPEVTLRASLSFVNSSVLSAILSQVSNSWCLFVPGIL